MPGGCAVAVPPDFGAGIAGRVATAALAESSTDGLLASAAGVAKLALTEVLGTASALAGAGMAVGRTDGVGTALVSAPGVARGLNAPTDTVEAAGDLIGPGKIGLGNRGAVLGDALGLAGRLVEPALCDTAPGSDGFVSAFELAPGVGAAEDCAFGCCCCRILSLRWVTR